MCVPVLSHTKGFVSYSGKVMRVITVQQGQPLLHVGILTGNRGPWETVKQKVRLGWSYFVMGYL